MSNTIIQLLDSLRQLLVMRLSEDDLRILCSHLGLHYDGLPAQGQAARTGELLKAMAQADRIYELVAAGKLLRPELSWDAAVTSGDL